MNQIPVDGRSPAAIAFHIELFRRAQDTCEIYNPSEKDYVIHHDQMVTNNKWIVPNKEKDVGHGKGVQWVPRFAAILYIDKFGIEMINKMIKDDWDSRKEQYRYEERGAMEERLALRSNDQRMWDKVADILFRGVVQRSGGEDIEDELDVMPTTENSSGSQATDTLNRLKIADREVGVRPPQADMTDAKDQLSQQLQ